MSLLVLPPDKGRKHSHLAVPSHKGGGWYRAECMGSAKACKAGACSHTRGLMMKHRSGVLRRVEQGNPAR